ncbi:hypothetical protein FLL45_20885 [Aliikangiella marina]|uniref:Uncharacterized protein n=1 Tax=Aliikangiella marina TaxID=1712262 RepID=A0A545T332_9GAMM|nr:hypothetical protein [Aliikangiella marina]TQV71608.1 hypothetical protein FLL45_20885 [Aliikangiella marina]
MKDSEKNRFKEKTFEEERQKVLFSSFMRRIVLRLMVAALILLAVSFFLVGNDFISNDLYKIISFSFYFSFALFSLLLLLELVFDVDVFGWSATYFDQQPNILKQDDKIANSSGIEVTSDESLISLLDESLDKQPFDLYYTDLIVASRKISKNMQNRAGIYLFSGVVIAAIGIFLFYLQVQEFSNNSGALEDYLSNMWPYVSILLFVEFIALFFLRQYKPAMDEFRHYDSITRSREDALAKLKLINEFDDKELVIRILDKIALSSSPHVLENGQTTDLIESKKFSKDELEIFKKIIDKINMG